MLSEIVTATSINMSSGMLHRRYWTTFQRILLYTSLGHFIFRKKHLNLMYTTRSASVVLVDRRSKIGSKAVYLWLVGCSWFIQCLIINCTVETSLPARTQLMCWNLKHSILVSFCSCWKKYARTRYFPRMNAKLKTISACLLNFTNNIFRLNSVLVICIKCGWFNLLKR